jgi:dTDP-4-amino-4,6-dideoxygalactose transaminase
MKIPILDLRAQHQAVKDTVVAALMEVVDSQTFILGKQVDQLEERVADLCGTRFAIGCASGTDALLLAYRALDVSAGDEIVTTPFTFFATAGAIHNVGAKPVFADIDPRTFNIDPVAAASVVTPRTKAIVAVDLFGQIAPIEQIAELCPSIPLVEDAAQSIGARRRVDGREVRAGENATIGTLSFFPSKNLGGYGDAGMIVTQDERIASRLRRLRVHGGLKTYYHEEVGFNSRLDTLQAAVLLAKLPLLESWSARRRANAAFYSDAFADVPEIVTPIVDDANTPIFNQYTIRADGRDQLQQHLTKNGIGSAIYYPLPLHLQKCFDYLGYPQGAFPHAERAASEVISLPVFPELTSNQRLEVVVSVRKFYGR